MKHHHDVEWIESRFRLRMRVVFSSLTLVSWSGHIPDLIFEETAPLRVPSVSDGDVDGTAWVDFVVVHGGGSLVRVHVA